jgi:hypothetical protein
MDRAQNGRRMFRHDQYLISLQEQTTSALKGWRAAQRILAEARPQLAFAQVFRCAVGIFDAKPRPDRQDRSSRPMRHPDLPELTAADLDKLAPIAASSLPAPTATFDVFLDWPTRWRSAVYLYQSAPPQWLTPFQRQFAKLSTYKYKPSGPQRDIPATIASNVIAKGGAK